MTLPVPAQDWHCSTFRFEGGRAASQGKASPAPGPTTLLTNTTFIPLKGAVLLLSPGRGRACGSAPLPALNETLGSSVAGDGSALRGVGSQATAGTMNTAQ